MVWNRLGRDCRKIAVWVPIGLFYGTVQESEVHNLAIMGDFSEDQPVGHDRRHPSPAYYVAENLRPTAYQIIPRDDFGPKAREKLESWRLTAKTARRRFSA